MRGLGFIKTRVGEKNFGFITELTRGDEILIDNSRGDLFFHKYGSDDDLELLQQDELVSYNIEIFKGRECAVQVTSVDNLPFEVATLFQWGINYYQSDVRDYGFVATAKGNVFLHVTCVIPRISRLPEMPQVYRLLTRKNNKGLEATVALPIRRLNEQEITALLAIPQPKSWKKQPAKWQEIMLSLIVRHSAKATMAGTIQTYLDRVWTTARLDTLVRVLLKQWPDLINMPKDLQMLCTDRANRYFQYSKSISLYIQHTVKKLGGDINTKALLASAIPTKKLQNHLQECPYDELDEWRSIETYLTRKGTDFEVCATIQKAIQLRDRTRNQLSYLTKKPKETNSKQQRKSKKKATKVILISKRGTKVENPGQPCKECGVCEKVLWRYAKSNYGTVFLCGRCKAKAFDRSFEGVDAIDMAYTSHFESNRQRH